MHDDCINEFFPVGQPGEDSATTSEIDENQNIHFKQLDQHHYKPPTDEHDSSPCPIKRSLQFKRWLEVPERTRKALEIRDPKSPQATGPSQYRQSLPLPRHDHRASKSV